MAALQASQRPANVGILAVEWYSPATFVEQTQLEEVDGCSGKYVVGLGQEAMAFADDREDIASILMTAVRRLLASYGVDPATVGRLEVGTETLTDKSKSVKTSLLRLFPGNANLEGVTSINACYGGTAALFNACAWVESSAWDGRYAVVACGDVAVYERGPARPSGGCGAVALLVGPDAPLALEPRRFTHAIDVWDFYKPHHSEYAAVDGRLSQGCYLRCVDACFAGLGGARDAAGAPPAFCVFHAPYNKLVRKAHARLALGDALRGGAAAEGLDAATWCAAGAPAYEASLADRALDGRLRDAAAGDYDARVAPSTALPRRVGNCYTASVFMGLTSLIAEAGASLEGKRILAFSYGSGAVATMYTFRARATSAERFALARIAQVVDVAGRLGRRVACSHAHFEEALNLREARYGRAGYAPSGAPATAPAPLAADAVRLAGVDERFIRSYA